MREIALDHDREAFATLFDIFAPRLKTFLARYGGGDALAEELAQETMLSVWRRADSFDAAKAAVSTWIFTIARNKRIDRLRQDRSAAAPTPDASDEAEASASGEDLVLAAEREGRVRAALAALPQEQARIVQMSFFSEKPHAEIARELDLPLGTVKSRVRLALARLRSLLGEDE